MSECKYELTFISEVYRVKQILKNILDFINDNIPQMSLEEKYDMRLIFSELLCNAVIHGNKEDATKNVRLSVEVADSTVCCEISDEGEGFDYEKHIMKLQNLEDDYLTNENGRGIWLVYSLTDSMAFNMHGNQIKFYKRVNMHE